MKARRVIVGGAIVAATLCAATFATYIGLDRTPGELLRKGAQRLREHPKLESTLSPLTSWARQRIERPVRGLDPPAAWRGAHTAAATVAPDSEGPAIVVDSVSSLVAAVQGARAGETIEIAPGRYRIKAQAIKTGAGGAASAPITFRARRLGDVVLDFEIVEGIHVTHPYWIFENLEIAGVCIHDGDCEHAFHVVGGAQSTLIRNNRIRDFNAHIKINGADGVYPDSGVIQSNTLYNTRPRKTRRPVTPIDLVGASNWQIADNFIADFVKAGGDRISYGAFIKGGGWGGRFERNIVVCALALQEEPGVRVGLSFGGGTTDPRFCRNGVCESEHDDGFAANNVIAHCNDFGLDVHRSRRTTLVHNTLINTAGIEVRDPGASALVSNNLLEGRVRQRGGGELVGANNWVGSAKRLFRDPQRLDLRWVGPSPEVPASPYVPRDLCGNHREARTPPGAVAGAAACIKPHLVPLS